MISASISELVVKLCGSKGSLRSQLFRGGVGSLAVKVGYVVLHFVLSVVLARTLGPNDFGVYSFALAVVTLLTIPAQFGFPGLVLRLTAIYHAQAQRSLLKGMLTVSALTVGGVSALLALVTAFVLLSIDAPPTGMPTGPLVVGCLLIPLLALLAVSDNALRGLGFVVIGQIPDALLRPALLLVLVGLAHWHTPLTALSAVTANVVATLIAFAIATWILSDRVPIAVQSTQAEYKTSDWTRASLPFLLLAGAQVINHQADLIMLGALTNQSQVGLYRVAVQVAEGLGVFLVAITVVISPHLARLHATQDWHLIRRILVNSHRTGVVILLPIAVAVALAADPLLQLLFGWEYSDSANTLRILLVGKLLYAGVCFSGIALSMFGLASVATIVTGLTAVLNVILNLVLIPVMGIEGAALATAISTFAVALGCIAWMRWRFGLDFSLIGISKRTPVDA